MVSLRYLIMPTMIQLTCAECSKEFEIQLREYNNGKKRFGQTDSDFCCSLSCRAIKTNRENPTKQVPPVQWGNQHGRKGDFTLQLGRIRNRAKKKQLGFNLTEDFLQELWAKQKGLCAISDVPLQKRLRETDALTPFTVSIDQIECGKGYTKDNVQLTCYSANVARNSFSIEEIKAFFNAVK